MNRDRPWSWTGGGGPSVCRGFGADVCWALVVLLVGAGVGGAQTVSVPAPRKHAAPAKITSPAATLTIDGRLSEPAWGDAPMHTGFEVPLGQPNRAPIAAEEQTQFQVLYDEDHLYFGIRCREPRMAEVVAAAGPTHDAVLWGDDDVEIFLDPVGDRTEYYQLAVNTEARQIDLYYQDGGNAAKDGWSSVWQAAVFKGTDFWSVEIELPFGLFHNRPSRDWVENWVFSICRTRKPAPAYYSQYSPTARYHDVADFGTLGPIRIDRSRFNLGAEAPAFRLEPAEGGYALTASLQVANRGDAVYHGELAMEVLAANAKGARTSFQLAPRSAARVELTGAMVPAPAKWPVVFRCQRELDEALVVRFDEWLSYVPLSLSLTQPLYRDSIFPTQAIDTIRGTVEVGVPLSKAKGMVVRVSLGSSVVASRSAERNVDTARVPFELPAGGLADGRYVLRAELLRPVPLAAGQKGRRLELVEEAEISLTKLPPAPAVEVRVDDQGNVLLDGQPVFIRGWYGGLDQGVGPSSFPRAQLSHSTNFVLSASEFAQVDLGIYTMVGLTRLIDEAKAKLDQPIDGELRAKLREVVVGARSRRQVIGYYLAEEPESRGLSSVFLRNLYEFMLAEDPYRVCMIVSREPAKYMPACDVICPNPYMNPLTTPEGARTFGNYIRNIHGVVTAAVRANPGNKAVWCMPQTFTFGGLAARQPSFGESRWFVHTAIACGAKGIVPFMFSGFWNHHESRAAMAAVFEELTWLAPAWGQRDAGVPVAADNPEVDVVGRFHTPPAAIRGHAVFVAANQSYKPAKATFRAPVLAEHRCDRLLVLRENRIVPVQNGTFADDFPGLGVHVYTTCEILPALQALEQIEADVSAGRRRAAESGNLLAAGKVRWWVGEAPAPLAPDAALADGLSDAAGWFPVYGDRTQCVVSFERPVSFSRVEVVSSTIKAAELDVWLDGGWKTLSQWRDQFLPRFEYKGPTVTTDRLRIRPMEARQGYGNAPVPEICELGIYE